jgi:hypothetical protein
VWCVPGTLGRLVLEFGKSLCDIAWHRHVDGSSCIIPVESETFGGDDVEFLESVGEMLDVLDSEIINEQTEDNGTVKRLGVCLAWT